MGFWRKLKVTLFGPKPKPFRLSPKPSIETTADGLDRLCQRFDARYERDMAGQQIRLCLLFKNGEKICGQGETTRDAFTALVSRVGVLNG